MSAVINAPGSGTSGDAAWVAGTWSGANQTAGKIAAGLITNIGTDLRNDHPIGIQYCGGGRDNTGAITGCRDQDFNPATTATINGNQVFWIDTGAPGTQQRTDVPLYVRPGEATATGPLVECGSCHDPHVSTGQAGPTGTGRVAGETFLRVSNANSAVCTACHVK